MKKIVSLLIGIALMAFWALPVLAAGLSISPPTVEFEVLANGSTEVEFLVYDFTGDLEISLEDIPLTVVPTTVSVTAEESGSKIVLTFYGDSTLGTQTFIGKIRFLAITGGTVAMGIKVGATVNHLSSREPLLEEGEVEASKDVIWKEASSDEVVEGSGELLPVTSESKSFPVLPVAGIVACTLIVITLIIVIAGRRQY